MGKGVDAARLDAPEHAAMIDDLKDQLLIAFLNRLGGKVDIPVAEIDATGAYLFYFNITNNTFHFVLEKKQ